LRSRIAFARVIFTGMTRLFVLAPLGLLAALAVSTPAIAAHASRENATLAEQYAARGVVKSFGPNRAYVNIAHEKIDGYMEAMTMSFEPRRPEQLAGLAPGDNVAFTFTATPDGHRLLDAIAKR
jgi:Cu/Ag efflux protein CusF